MQLYDLETLNIDSETSRHVEKYHVEKRESEENITKERHKAKLNRLKVKTK